MLLLKERTRPLRLPKKQDKTRLILLVVVASPKRHQSQLSRKTRAGTRRGEKAQKEPSVQTTSCSGKCQPCSYSSTCSRTMDQRWQGFHGQNQRSQAAKESNRSATSWAAQASKRKGATRRAAATNVHLGVAAYSQAKKFREWKSRVQIDARFFERCIVLWNYTVNTK